MCRYHIYTILLLLLLQLLVGTIKFIDGVIETARSNNSCGNAADNWSQHRMNWQG